MLLTLLRSRGCGLLPDLKALLVARVLLGLPAELQETRR
jgi:hypothetical protein